MVVHSSADLYGSDRMLLLVARTLSPSTDLTFLLPTSADESQNEFARRLTDHGAVEHRALPILRRQEISVSSLLRLVRQAAGLYRALRVLRPRVVYCATSACLVAAVVARLSGVRTVALHNQEIWRPGWERTMLSWLASACTAVVSVSQAAHDSLGGRIQPISTVVANGVDALEDVSARHGEGPLTFLVASRWHSWKGHGTLFRAWDLAGAPGRLVVLGGPSPAADRVDVHALRASVSAPETVDIVGEVEDIAAYVERADVVLVPSDRPEPFGLVALEAFRAGRPVVASRAGGLAEVVDDGQNGWLFEPGSVEELAEVLRRLSPASVAAAGEVALRTFGQGYTSDQFMDRFRAFWAASVDVPGRSRRRWRR